MGLHSNPPTHMDAAGRSPLLPDPTKLVERLQSLKNRLANMAVSLENSVAAATPIKGSASEEIMYSTHKMVKEFLDGPAAQDRSIFISSDYVPQDDEHIMEIRFTVTAQNQEEVDHVVSQLRKHPEIDPTSLKY